MINLSKLEEHLIKVLEQGGCEPEPKAIQTIVTEWYRQKQPLIELLSQHPDWDEEKLAIVQQVSISLTDNINKPTIKRFYDWIIENAHLGDRQANYLNQTLDLRTRCKISSYASREFTYQINSIISGVDAISTTKSSRVINKLCEVLQLTNLPDYNRLFAAFSDAISSKPINTNFVLSLHPVDYLLMSNGVSWTSCHNFSNGCYRSGTISYMLDKVTMVAYSVKSLSPQTILCEQKKINRQLFMYQDKNLLQSRLYPQNCDNSKLSVGLYDGFKEFVLNIVKQCLNDTTAWSSMLYRNNYYTFRSFVKTSGATCYEDWIHSYPLMTINLPKSTTLSRTIYVGAPPLSIKTGQPHRETSYLYERGR